MTFGTLYGTELDRELGSSSTVLFTTTRRKAAINAAQLEWVKRTECLTKETSVSLVDGTQEYDLEATITDFGWIAKQGLRIKIVGSSTTTYIEGDDLRVTTVARLDTDEPGWRGVGAGTPTKVYLRRDGGRLYVGLHPAPDIAATDTWTLVVPYVIVPADMSLDADEPFTVSTNVLISLRPWHRALALYGAAYCEQFRKDQSREAVALQKWEAEILRFMGNERPKAGQMIRLARDYRRTRMPSWQNDPRRRG